MSSKARLGCVGQNWRVLYRNGEEREVVEKSVEVYSRLDDDCEWIQVCHETLGMKIRRARRKSLSLRKERK